MAHPIWAGIFTAGQKPTVRKNQPGPYYMLCGVGEEVVRVTMNDDGTFQVHMGPTDNPDNLLLEGQLDATAVHSRKRRRGRNRYAMVGETEAGASAVAEGKVVPLTGTQRDPVEERLSG